MPGDGPELEVEFSGDIWYWRGPSPFHFVTVPAEPSEVIKAMSSAVTYGWGMIPVRVWIGDDRVRHRAVPEGRPLRRAAQGQGPR